MILHFPILLVAPVVVPVILVLVVMVVHFVVVVFPVVVGSASATFPRAATLAFELVVAAIPVFWL